MKKLQKGFTLIELLVVIAIIGILSSVVLASLSSARTRGNDTAVRSELANMRSQAQLFFSNSGNFGSTTTAEPAGSYSHCLAPNSMFVASSTGSLRSMLISVASKTGGSGGIGSMTSRVVCATLTNGIQTQWAVMASTTGVGNNWCVDSTGASRAANTIVNGACDTTTPTGPITYQFETTSL
jgi:prepilin-type N-terminal cleavage/methylation domain-containing protein